MVKFLGFHCHGPGSVPRGKLISQKPSVKKKKIKESKYGLPHNPAIAVADTYPVDLKTQIYTKTEFK